MRRLQNSTMEDEKIDEMNVDELEGDESVNPSANHERATTKKDKNENMKQMLSEVTRTHEFLAKKNFMQAN